MKLNKRKITTSITSKLFKPFYFLAALVLFCSHDLYIKLETYFLQPNQEAVLNLYNGTFEKSDNTIARDRMLDASIVSHGNRVAINPEQWQDQDSTITKLTFNTGDAGTYVAGVSTRARNIELTAEKFNKYLKSDGVLDMLKQRTADSLLDQDVVENYQKHVKAIYQVGDVKTDDWKTVLGYPIEFVPMANPYEKHTGEQLDVQLLLDGKPLANQLVFADAVKGAHAHSHDENTHKHSHEDKTHSHEHSHDDGDHDHKHNSGSSEAHSHEHKHKGEVHSHKHAHDTNEHEHSHNAEEEKPHSHTSGQQLRTNDKGIVTVDLPEDGIYYLRTIHMTRVADSDELTHRSKWATLTFEVGHAHNADTHTHNHDHDHEDGIPIWMFILGSVAFIGLLFFIFRKKDS
jgi:uncharacterized GH25 family protein